ncbi:MAG: hypothetical protein ABR538_04870, partial [Candidatus Binatia bacterium]
MRRRAFLFCGVVLAIGVGAAVRLWNALHVPVLGGYDAFAHFTYIWFLADTGRVPLADAGWEFFQPPLYYALMASFWRALPELDPELRLRLGTAFVAILGLAHAGVLAAILKRRFAGRPLIRFLSAGLLLFLPVLLYSAGFLGNEGLNAVLCSISLLLLVRTLQGPKLVRAAALGLVLGLAMLTKFTALVVVAASLLTLVLDAVVRGDWKGGARTTATVLVVLLATCGWHYARNLERHRTLFPLSRHQLFLERVENSQLQGERRVLEYLLFDPGILYRPQWPRGVRMNAPRPPGVAYSAVRESIPTGLYANTWFDGFGGFAVPPITESEASRRAGQLLLTLGLVPTGLMLLGLVAALDRLRRRGWDSTAFAMLASLAAMVVVLVVGTRSVPTQAAVKATYLLPVSVPFAFLFALGLDKVSGWFGGRALAAVAGACAALAVTSVLVFTHGLVVSTEWFRSGEENSLARSLRGVIAYAGGDLDVARVHFEKSARGGWHVGYENLAALALRGDDLDAAAWLLLEAARRQPGQSRGSREERQRAIATTQAEYANSMAVILHRMGRDEEARQFAERAIRLDPTIPESFWNLGVFELLGAEDGEAGPRSAERAEKAFARSAGLDPSFVEARAMRG